MPGGGPRPAIPSAYRGALPRRTYLRKDTVVTAMGSNNSAVRSSAPGAAWYFATLASLLLAWPAPLDAQEQLPPDTLRLAQAVARARQANPMLEAARLRADAAAQRVSQVGALPDPQLAFALMNRPVSGFGTGEPMTMNQVQLSQVLPWPGKLGFAEERARRFAVAESLSAEDVEVELVARVRDAYYEIAYIDRAIAIMERTRDLLRDFFQVSQAMYSVGDVVQQDVLRAQVAVARMTEEITAMRQDRLARAARLNALLGREATRPVGPATSLSAATPVASADSLMALAVERRPALRAARERVAAAEAGYRAARRELFPDVMVSLAYGHRPQFGDMATLMIGFNLPLWAGSRQLAARREMAAMQASEEAMARDLYNETFAQLTELRADAERARELSALYATAIVPQARAAVEAALSAYRVGRVDYMTLVDNEMTVNRYEIESVRLTARYHQAVARIEALLGETGGEP